MIARRGMYSERRLNGHWRKCEAGYVWWRTHSVVDEEVAALSPAVHWALPNVLVSEPLRRSAQLSESHRLHSSFCDSDHRMLYFSVEQWWLEGMGCLLNGGVQQDMRVAADGWDPSGDARLAPRTDMLPTLAPGNWRCGVL